MLEIPTIGVNTEIVGIPASESAWDVSWLWEKAGYLEGTAFPTTPGNTVITSHVYLPDGLPGPFIDLRNLKFGDEVIIHAWGQRYVYQVQEVTRVRPHDLSILKHSDYDMVTLLSCEGFDEETDSYDWRTIVKAIVVRVEVDN